MKATFGGRINHRPTDTSSAVTDPQKTILSEGRLHPIPPEEWVSFGAMTLSAFVKALKSLAKHVDVDRFRKRRRGPKKPQPVSTQGGAPVGRLPWANLEPVQE